MPSLEVSSLHLKAVYWAYSSKNEYGEPVVSSPVELNVRWEYGLAKEIRPTTSPQAIDVTLWVSQDVVANGMIWLGALTDLPSPVTSVLEIVEFQKIPDIKGRSFERVALLRKYANSLPTVA